MGLPLSLFYPNKMVGRAREVVRSHVDVGPGNEDCDDAATSAIIEAAVYKRAGMATQCQPHITLHMRTLFLVMMAFRSTITFHLNAIPFQCQEIVKQTYKFSFCISHP